jgi:hypothetical protein
MTKSKAIIDSVVDESSTYCVTDSRGVSRWFDNDGKVHSEGDLPAVVDPRGDKQWFRHGVLHREGGPSYISADGQKVWYSNGKCHRLDGPAVEQGDKRYYFVDDRQFTEDEFYRYVDQETGEVLLPPGKKLHYD